MMCQEFNPTPRPVVNAWLIPPLEQAIIARLSSEIALEWTFN
jgi:hypothetical protein